MNRFLYFVILFLLTFQPVLAFDYIPTLCFNDECAVKNLLKSQVHYANRANFKRFIETYDEEYTNSDGFNYQTYSNLVKDIWSAYGNIDYSINIKKITVNGDKAVAELVENSYAKLDEKSKMPGELKSVSNSIYYLQKKGKKWRVISDSIIDEDTSMLYGVARDLDIKLTVPNSVKPNSEYCASLEFTPPKEMLAIASIAADKVEYPQRQAEEVFRAMPDDHILERLFIANNDNVNEYIVASIGLTKSEVCDLSIKLSLTGFGYTIKRVNVLHQTENSSAENDHDENK